MARTAPVLEDTSPVCCAPLCETGPLDEGEAVAVAARLKALGDPVRLQLVAMLLAAEGREACTCDLAPGVGLSEPTVSHHLKQLLQAGLVTKERRGTNVYYRPEPEALRAVGRVLAVDC
ncbi:metalloregulator ArsR/SmtB family transcription factor [Aquipuribacter nitratireducens]|uniref:Metalloregulator ArsR/SmtB family transcription factor n=1 Tax=Aquipuribacter nitratireducens TaxID=650104 RepID=A0ABW0GP77_9MICO